MGMPAVRMDSYLDQIHRPGAEMRKVRFDGYRRTFVLSGIAEAMHMDANETALFARQLEEIDVQLYDAEYPEFQGTKLVPTKVINEGAELYTYRMRDRVGNAKLITNFATDFPTVSVTGREESTGVKSYGDSYIYSIQDLRAAKMAGWSIETDLAEIARWAIALQIDNTIWFGNSAVGLTGFANNPYVTLVTGINGNWHTEADPRKILADMLKLEQAAYNASNGVEMPDTMVLPQVRYARIATEPLSTTNPDVTILDYFLKKSQFVKSVEKDWRLNTANATGDGPRAICYKRDPKKVQVILPFEFRQYPVQTENLAFKVPCEGKVGGTIFRYPGSARYMDGI
jgi:hypothetical protein